MSLFHANNMMDMESLNIASSKSADDWLPVWPSEEAPAQFVEEYFRKATPLITLKGFDFDVRGETPPSMLKYDNLTDVRGLTEMTPAADATVSQQIAIQKHNLMLRSQINANALLVQQGTLEKRRHRNLFAQAIILSLTPNAPVRLEALMTKHAVAGHANTYNGTEMWKDLIKLKTADSLTTERVDHDRVLESMRDNMLADGCSAQEYSHRVKTLQRWHISASAATLPKQRKAC